MEKGIVMDKKKLIDEIDRYIDDLYELRQSSIEKEGEYGKGNLIFKEIRNLGYLDNLKDLKKKLTGDILSLESLEEDKKLFPGYPSPERLYDISDDTASFSNQGRDYIWWGSEADDYAENYARSYEIRLPIDKYLDLTTRKGNKDLKLGDYLGGRELRDLDMDEFNKENYQPIYLIVEFRGPNIAEVIGHEGRHRAFALKNHGVRYIDVELKVSETDKNFDKYFPFNIKKLKLIGQFNKEIQVNVDKVIPMSWKQHQIINPDVKKIKYGE